MQPMEYIRKNVFQVSQAAFAVVAGVAQPTVWRWEQGISEPHSTELSRIRAAAVCRGLNWDDCWLFETPKTDENVEAPPQ
jgi:transcriptional regulator with XRE-family HTH domain